MQNANVTIKTDNNNFEKIYWHAINWQEVRTPSQSEGLDGYEQPKGLPLLIKILLIRQSLNYQVALDS